MACSYHIDDRLPHLRAAGIEVETLTSILGRRPKGTDGVWHRIPSINPSGYRFEARRVARELPRPWDGILKRLLTLPVLPLYVLEKRLINLDSTFWWWVPAGLVGIWIAGRRRPDLVYSTGGAPTAHAAAALIAWVRRVPWIAEIQDPLIYQGIGRGVLVDRLLRRFERLIHERADGVVYVTETARARAVRRAGRGAECITIYPGGERRTGARTRVTGQEMRVAHIGTLGDSRNPSALLDALARLVARRPEARRQLRLWLVGSTDKPSREKVRRFPFPEMLEAPGKVSRREALDLMAGCDLLLVIQNRARVSEETIPSKTYEYLASGRAVLALVHRNPELAELVRAAGHTAVEGDDVEAVTQALEDAYDRWRRNALGGRSCEKYSPARAAGQLIAWSRSLRRGATGSAGSTRVRKAGPDE